MDDCKDRNHVGLDKVMLGGRLPDPSLGQDAAFLAFVLGGLEALIDKLQAENARLRDAIEKHREANGHNQCWENDEELYEALQDGKTVEKHLPPRCEFRENCRKYYESRKGAEKKEDGW